MSTLLFLLVILPFSLANTCPDRCIDPTWAAVQCVAFPTCNVIPCTRVVDGVERQWASCSEPTPTPAPPTQMPCPDRCIDPTWAIEKCVSLPHCVVLPCTRIVKGVERDWASCSDPTPEPTPTPTSTPSPVPSIMPCPGRCIDPTWAVEKCAMLPHCVVTPCTRVVNGVEREWASCSDPTPTPAPPVVCPDRCIDPTWAREKCRMMPGCQVVPCVRVVNGVERQWAKCSPASPWVGRVGSG